MATLGEWVLLNGVTLCDITLPTVFVDVLKVSITFFSNTFTTMDSVSAEILKIEEHVLEANKWNEIA